MILLAVLVGTSTVSDDGSISGMYKAGINVARKTYAHGAERADDLRRVTEGLVSAPAGSGATELKADPPAKDAAPAGAQQPEQEKR
jgi:hypothetical protein